MTPKLLLLRKSPNQALEKIYLNYRRHFLRILKKNNIAQEDAIVIYQDSFIALREHCIDGTFDSSKITMKSGLIAISEVLLRERQLVVKDDAWSPKKPFDHTPLFSAAEITFSQRVLIKNFKSLGLRCQKMLSLFYYRRLSLPEIIQILGHETELIVKRQKTRCLLSLKEAVHSDAYEEKELLLDHYVQHTLSPIQQERFDYLLAHDEEFTEDLKFITDLQAITASIERKDFKTTMVTFERNLSSKQQDHTLIYPIKKWGVLVLLLVCVSIVLWLYFS